MKINEIKLLAIELEEWAMKDGRKGAGKDSPADYSASLR